MRKLFAFFLILAAGVSVAEAASYRYVFTGTVSDLFYDGGGVLASAGVKVGDPVAATFDVRFDATGYQLQNDGKVYVMEDPPDYLTNSPYVSFAANLVEGSLLPILNGGLWNTPADVAEYHFSWTRWTANSPNQALIWGGSSNSYITVRRDSYTEAGVRTWQVGDAVKGIFVGTNDKDWSIAWANMTVQSITEIADLPDVVGKWRKGQAASKAARAQKAAVLAQVQTEMEKVKRQLTRVKTIDNDRRRERLLRQLRKELKRLKQQRDTWMAVVA